MPNIDFYEYGRKAWKKDRLFELKSKKDRLKNELLNALNEPMNVTLFKQISDEVIEVLNRISELENQIF